MRILITLLASLMMLAGPAAIAQVTVSYAMDTPTFTLAHEDTDKYETLDTCYLNVSYQFKYRNSDQVIEYSEQSESPEWTYIPDEIATVMDYHCHVATCNYGGRNWKVYYTNDIPVPYGPWKLNGVKGLVLKAEDSENNFIFEAVGLTQKPQPIIRYDWSRKKMKKEDWKKYEQEMYKNAGAFVRNTGARILIMDNSEQGFHRLNEDWSQYYNPLER